MSCLREPRSCLRARNQPNIDQFVQQFFKRVIAVQTPYLLSVDELVGLHFRRQRRHHGQGHHANKKLAAHCGVAVHAGRMQIQACLQARECFLNAVPSSINRQGLLRVFHLVAYEGKEAHVTHFGVDCIVITNESTAIVAEHKQGLQGRLVRSVSALPALLIFQTRFSKPCRARWNVYFGGDYDFEFKGSPSIYRFWDATAQAEFMASMCEEALDVCWVQEVKWLGEFDRIRKEVEQQFDVRSSTLSLLISVGLEEGRLSKNIRAKFADKVEPELFDFIEARLPSEV